MNNKKIIGTIGQNNSKKVIDKIINSTSKPVEEKSKVVSPQIVTPVVKEVNKQEDKKVVNTTTTTATTAARAAAKPVTTKAKSTRTAPKVEQKRAASKSTKTTKTTAKKAAASKVEKINYEEILGSEPIKLIISKEKKVTDYKITVALRNYNYDKYVYVKYSEDNWKTEKKADLSFKSSEENNIEIWSTSIKINPKKVDDFRFAVAYAVNAEEFWDNNCGQDYTF